MLEPVSRVLQEFWGMLGKPGPERPKSVNGSVFWSAKTPEAPYLLVCRQRCGTRCGHPVSDLGHGTCSTVPVLALRGRARSVHGQTNARAGV